MGDAKPAMVWPLASYLAEEMQERGWCAVDVAERMPGRYERNVMLVNLLLAVQTETMILTDDVIADLGKAFGVSFVCFRRLHDVWLENCEARQPFTCPENLFGGIIFPANDDGAANAPRPADKTGEP